MMLIAAHDVASFTPAAGTKIATKYPAITREFLRRRGYHFDIVPLQGSVELAAVLNLAPYIVDLVETGETIRVHDLRPLETIEEIAPRVIVSRSAYRIRNSEIRALLTRLGGRAYSPSPSPSESPRSSSVAAPDAQGTGYEAALQEEIEA